MADPRRLGLPASLVAVGLALAACQHGEAARSPGDAGSDLSSVAPGGCSREIPPDVVEGLGWRPGDPPTDRLGGCGWEGPDGLILVSPELGTLESLCRRLERQGPASGYEATPDWLTGDVDGCVRRPPGEVGQSLLMVAGDGGEVTSVRLMATSATDPAKVQAALATLAQTAAEG